MKSRFAFSILALCVLTVAAINPAVAKPISHTRTVSNIDWTSAGIAGVGGGSGTITLTTVKGIGVIKQAFLYWHGINIASADGVYDNPNIIFAGHPVTGVALGDAGTNCWGPGSSRAFEADVTAFVTGNGSYAISGMASQPGYSPNGASLVVIYDDGDPTNNRDLVFFVGNDSNIPEGFPGEDPGWNATLTPILYRGGAVRAEFHVADGQDFPDDSVVFSTANGTQTIVDTPTLWDGNSLPSAGTSRAPNGGLWDIHDIDMTPAFGGVPGSVTLTLSGQVNANDCLSLVVMLLDLEPGSAPRIITNFANLQASVQLKNFKSKFEAQGSFTLGPDSDGINLSTDDVVFSVGVLTLTIPKNSFKLNAAKTAFTFEGRIAGESIEATITPQPTPGTFSFHFEGNGDPTNGANPVPLSLTIGNDTGSTLARIDLDSGGGQSSGGSGKSGKN
ncbi:MAG TPA: hypothetical protein VGH51_12215 [Candidatus Angelobacter sp.]